MRREKLFDLGHLCSVPAHLVDALRFWDFIQLALDIDAYNEAMKKRDEALGELAI